IEVGRKVRGPSEEEPGVNTYSALWGRRNAVLVWLGALLVTAAFALVAAWEIHFLAPVGTLLAVLLLAAGLIAGRFVRRPGAGRTRAGPSGSKPPRACGPS